MEILDKLSKYLADLWDKTREQIIYQPVDKACVDDAKDYIPLEYGRHYLRLWLTRVYLAQQVQYLQSWFPAVHALVKFDFQGTPVEFPTVADASKVKMTQDAMKGDVVAANYVLTPLIPFNNGTIELDAGLLAIQGENYLNNFISTLSDFSNLLAIPQFSTALSIAEPLAKGLQSLLSMGGVQLALHDGFAAGRTGGYWMAVRATNLQLDPTELLVRKDQLHIQNHYDPNQSQQLEGYDYMLFRLEVTETGPDYTSLASIQGPMKQAHQALKDVDQDKADGFYRAAIIAAHESPELTRADRIRVKQQLKDDYEELKKNLGFSGLVGDEYDLGKSMSRAISVDTALKMGEPSFGELFHV